MWLEALLAITLLLHSPLVPYATLSLVGFPLFLQIQRGGVPYLRRLSISA